MKPVRPRTIGLALLVGMALASAVASARLR